MADIAIQVENLSKRYRIGLQEEQHDTFAAATLSTLRQPFQNLHHLRRLTRFSDEEDDVIWALKDISFKVKPGEVLGIIGPNGAGKSTLLKILSRITHPTRGRIELSGRVCSLLEVGTGFHPELTGRENIYLNGTILGMRKAEIDRKFDEIVDFSGVEKFLDTPIKRYSSGMQVRLAFSVAAHLEPEILLVDEVLAVGDAAYQKKCLGKMSNVAQTGRTILFVSHNLAAIRNLCERAILIQQGQIKYDGDVAHAITSYHHCIHRDQPIQDRRSLIVFSNVRFNQQGDFSMHSGDPIKLNFHIDFGSYLPSASFWFIIEDIENNTILHHRIEHYQLFNTITRGIYEVSITVPALWLRPGVYSSYIKVQTHVLKDKGRFLSDRWMIDVKPSNDIPSLGMVNPPIFWTAELLTD